MHSQLIYVPILKWKMGEYSALKELYPSDKTLLIPLAEIPPVPWDWVKDQLAETIDVHLSDIPKQIEKSWGDCAMFVDLVHLDPGDRMADGAHPVTHLFSATSALGLKTIPVTSPGRDPAYQAAVAAVAANDKLGACVRLTNDDAFAADIGQRLEGLMQALVLAPTEIDLVIDLGSMMPGEEARNATAVRGLLASLPHVHRWRSLICAGTSFPQNMSSISPGIQTIPRSEWKFWMTLITLKNKIPRLPTFGDYAISHPDLVEMDPRLMTMSANIRYTIASDWLIFRGRSVEKFGSAQHMDFCKALVSRSEYSGKTFSAGDKHIDLCANGGTGNGNATTWRRVATNHHITFVVRQVATLVAASAGSTPALGALPA